MRAALLVGSFLAALLGGAATAKNTEEYELWHSIDSHAVDLRDTVDSFKLRGSIQGSQFALKTGGNFLYDEVDFSSSDRKALATAAVAQDAVYRVMVKLKKGKESYISSIPACLLASSDFKDRLNLYLDNQDKLFHIQYNTEVSHCDSKSTANRILASNILVFNTTVNVLRHTEGPKPEVEKELNIKSADGVQKQEEESFIKKYWYIIVPIVLLLLVGGGDGGQPQKPGQQGGQAAPASGGSAKK